MCGKLSSEYCCSCYFKNQQESNREYSSYEKTLTNRQQEQKERFQQLQLLKNYQGCQQCGSLEADAYSLYEENRIVCQPCLTSKEGSSSSPINFWEQSKWYKKHWKIDLKDWLEKDCLPINRHCANKWLKDKEHWKNCACLDQESQEIYLLFSKSLERYQQELENCSCQTSKKVRVSYLTGDGSGWTCCEKCEQEIASAGHHGVIKNQNDPKFWGLAIKEKVLCLDCLKKLQGKMPINKKYTFNKYLKRYDF